MEHRWMHSACCVNITSQYYLCFQPSFPSVPTQEDSSGPRGAVVKLHSCLQMAPWGWRWSGLTSASFWESGCQAPPQPPGYPVGGWQSPLPLPQLHRAGLRPERRPRGECDMSPEKVRAADPTASLGASSCWLHTEPENYPITCGLPGQCPTSCQLLDPEDVQSPQPLQVLR